MSLVIEDQQRLPQPQPVMTQSWAGMLFLSLSHATKNWFLTRKSSNMSSAIVTLVVGSEQRLFAAHEDVLCSSSFFNNALRNTYMDPSAKKIALPDEEPEIFSSVLEYLYKGDYFPRLMHNKRRNSWELEPADAERAIESTVYHRGIDGDLLKDTVIYCAAEKYGLDELKKLALRKQGLRELGCLLLPKF